MNPGVYLACALAWASNEYVLCPCQNKTGLANADLTGWPGRSLTGEKKKCSGTSFPKKSPRALHVLNHGWWRLAIGSWQLAVGGGWCWLAVGAWSPLAVGGGWWRLVVGGWWRLAVDGSWRLVVGGPLGRSLAKKKIWSLKDRPGDGRHRPGGQHFRTTFRIKPTPGPGCIGRDATPCSRLAGAVRKAVLKGVGQYGSHRVLLAKLAVLFWTVAWYRGGGNMRYLEWRNLVRRNVAPISQYHCKIWYKIPRMWHNHKHTLRMLVVISFSTLAGCC